jgi:hypothetical protein
MPAAAAQTGACSALLSPVKIAEAAAKLFKGVRP